MEYINKKFGKKIFRKHFDLKYTLTFEKLEIHETWLWLS